MGIASKYTYYKLAQKFYDFLITTK